MAAWKQAGFRVVEHLIFTKTYASKSAFVDYQYECAYILAKGRPELPAQQPSDVQHWEYTGNRHYPTEKHVSIFQPLIESFTQPSAIVLDPLLVAALPVSPLIRQGGAISVSSFLRSTTLSVSSV